MTNERPEPRSGDVRSIQPGSPSDVAEREDRAGPDVVSLIPDPPQREFVFDEPDEPANRETLAETEDLDLPEPGSRELDDALDEDPDPWAAEADSLDDRYDEDEDEDDDLLEAEDELDRIPSLEDDEPGAREVNDEHDAEGEEREEPPGPARRAGRLQRPIDAEFGTGLGSDEVRDGETIGYLESALGDGDDTGRDSLGPVGPDADEAFGGESAGGPGQADDPAPAPSSRPHLRLVRPGEAPPPLPVDVPRAGSEAPPAAEPPAVEPPASRDADELGPEVLVAAAPPPLEEPPAALDGIEPDEPPGATRWQPEPEARPSDPSETRLRRQRLAAQDDAASPGPQPRRAPLRARVAAMVVDGGLVLLFVPLTVLVGVLAFGLDGYRAVPAATARGIAFSAVNGLLVLSVAVYFGLSQGFAGSTPGKQLMRIKVVRAEDGKPIGFGRSLLRVAAYGLNLLTLGGGFLYALYDPRGRGLHDILTQTFVARDD